jgi:hypothetical protein
MNKDMASDSVMKLVKQYRYLNRASPYIAYTVVILES